MKDTDIVEFLHSHFLFPRAQRFFQQEHQKLAILFPYVDIQHVGSAAIPGAVGKFDVNIQLRVPYGSFAEVVRHMKKMYEGKHAREWTTNFAHFSGFGETYDYVVTIVDSREDCYFKTRDYLINNQLVLKEYNDLKWKYHGKTYGEYKRAKQKFLRRIIQRSY